MYNIKTYEKWLVLAGFRLEEVSTLSDAQILNVRGIGQNGLAVIRLKYGPIRPHKPVSLEDEIVTALTPVLLKRRGVGLGTIRKVSRMVAMFIET